MFITLKGFQDFQSRLLFDSIKKTITKCYNASDYNYNGEYKDLDVGRLFFYRIGDSLKILLNKNEYDLNDFRKVCLKKNKGIYELKIFIDNIDEISIEEKVSSDLDLLTISDSEDNSILELIYNIYNSKKRQELIYK